MKKMFSMWRGWTAMLMLMMVSVSANAKVSDWVRNLGLETTAITGILIVIFGAVGIVFVAFALISVVNKKKQQGASQPLTWEGWGIAVGVLLLLLIPLIANLGESVTDDETLNTDAFYSKEGFGN